MNRGRRSADWVHPAGGPVGAKQEGEQTGADQEKNSQDEADDSQPEPQNASSTEHRTDRAHEADPARRESAERIRGAGGAGRNDAPRGDKGALTTLTPCVPCGARRATVFAVPRTGGSRHSVWEGNPLRLTESWRDLAMDHDDGGSKRGHARARSRCEIAHPNVQGNTLILGIETPVIRTLGSDSICSQILFWGIMSKAPLRSGSRVG